MNREKIHIIITGEERASRSFTTSQPMIKACCIGAGVIGLVAMVGVGLTSLLTINNGKLRTEVTQLSTRLSDSHWSAAAINQAHQQLEKKYHQVVAVNNKQQSSYNTLYTQNDNAAAQLQKITQELERARHEIAQLKNKNQNLLAQFELKESEVESVWNQIGLKVKIKEDPKHSGGLYLPPQENRTQELFELGDQYLHILHNLPLGKPIGNSISSKFGYRIDPIKKTKAFHSGIDFTGRIGDKVFATANGRVSRAGFSKGIGRHIKISHGNGYETLFAHLSKILVKRGQRIKRGQPIGLVGNTGRSTGSHLHYELHLNGKSINPIKSMQVAKLSITLAPEEQLLSSTSQQPGKMVLLQPIKKKQSPQQH